jgi:hypothetical protein
MRSSIHVIPLRAVERSLVLGVLNCASERGHKETGLIAAVIAASPPRSDGLIDIAIDERTRACVESLIGRECRVRADPHRVDDDPTADRDFSFVRLWRMFGPDRVLHEPVYQALRNHEDWQQFFRPKSEYSLAFGLREALFIKCYRIDKNLDDLRRFERKRYEVQRLAFTTCEVAGLARLRMWQKGRMATRVYIDWYDWMWRPAVGRRPVLSSESAIDPLTDAELDEVAAFFSET